MIVRRHWATVLLFVSLGLVGAFKDCTEEESACVDEVNDVIEGKKQFYRIGNDSAKLEALCIKQKIASKCMNSYAKNCLTPQSQTFYQILTKGSTKFTDLMCSEDSALRENYLRHAVCLKDSSRDLNACFDKYEFAQNQMITDFSDTEKVIETTCRLYFENINCTSFVAKVNCGSEAGDLVTKSCLLLGGTYLNDKCRTYADKYILTFYDDPDDWIVDVIPSQALKLQHHAWIITLSIVIVLLRHQKT